MRIDYSQLEIRSVEDGVIVSVKANAGAKSNSIGGIHDGAIRVSITQVAEKGKANKAIIELLSKRLGIAKSRIHLVSGQSNSRKTFHVAEINAASFLELINGRENR